MRTRRMQPAPSRSLPAREPFESSALYDLVATLAIESYADLLAPHWVSPDRASAHARLERERFTRRRSPAFARTAMALHADGSRMVPRGRRRHHRALAVHDLAAWLAAADEHAGGVAPEPRDEPPAPRQPFEWVRAAVAACASWLRRLGRRSWR
jgi:hypothetical protein